MRASGQRRFFRRPSFLLLLLLLLLTLEWPPMVCGCSLTVLHAGVLPEQVRITERSMPSSCSCCGLCYQMPSCHSFSWIPNNGGSKCRFYNTVGTYKTILRYEHEDRQYFVMSGRSNSSQFCRKDTDCIQDGDACRGRVCTNLKAVTCKTIYKTFGVEARSEGSFHTSLKMYGWLDKEVILMCRMGSKEWEKGSTMLLKVNKDTSAFTNVNLDRLEQNEAGDVSHLDLAEKIREAGSGTNYTVTVWFSDHNYVQFVVNHTEVVIGTEPRTVIAGDITTHPDQPASGLSLPYRPSSNGKVLLSIAATHPDKQDAGDLYGQVVRTDGQMIKFSGRPANTLRLTIIE